MRGSLQLRSVALRATSAARRTTGPPFARRGTGNAAPTIRSLFGWAWGIYPPVARPLGVSFSIWRTGPFFFFFFFFFLLFPSHLFIYLFICKGDLQQHICWGIRDTNDPGA